MRAQARQLIRDLSEDPRPTRAKELRGKPNLWRIWLAGSWRIAYKIDDELEKIRIVRVRHKDFSDYESLGEETG